MQAAIPIAVAAAEDEECEEWYFLIRRSRDDIGSFATPTCFSDATGAEFAWADDRIDENQVWSARGIIAKPFVSRGAFKLNEPYIDTIVLAPYANFDRVANSKNVAKDVDNLTYGGVFEASVANVLNATHYFNLSGEAVSSFAGEAKNWSIDLEWHPVGGLSSEYNNPLFSYFGTPLPLGRYFTWSINPSLQAEYVSDLSDTAQQPIFAEHNEAFRAGPSLLLTVDGKSREDFSQIPWWASRIHYQIAYSWLYDLLSGRDYELLDTALKIGLDPSGHLGLTFSYRNGQLFETGQDVDLANIALSVSY
jgi:hypothetical protein